VKELDPEEGAPILKRYLELEGFVLPYFDVNTDSPLEEFVKEAEKRPVFLLLAE
jgi:hypothetical protein